MVLGRGRKGERQQPNHDEARHKTCNPRESHTNLQSRNKQHLCDSEAPIGGRTRTKALDAGDGQRDTGGQVKMASDQDGRGGARPNRCRATALGSSLLPDDGNLSDRCTSTPETGAAIAATRSECGAAGVAPLCQGQCPRDNRSSGARVPWYRRAEMRLKLPSRWCLQTLSTIPVRGSMAMTSKSRSESTSANRNVSGSGAALARSDALGFGFWETAGICRRFTRQRPLRFTRCASRRSLCSVAGRGSPLTTARISARAGRECAEAGPSAANSSTSTSGHRGRDPDCIAEQRPDGGREPAGEDRPEAPAAVRIHRTGDASSVTNGKDRALMPSRIVRPSPVGHRICQRSR